MLTKVFKLCIQQNLGWRFLSIAVVHVSLEVSFQHKILVKLIFLISITIGGKSTFTIGQRCSFGNPCWLNGTGIICHGEPWLLSFNWFMTFSVKVFLCTAQYYCLSLEATLEYSACPDDAVVWEEEVNYTRWMWRYLFVFLQIQDWWFDEDCHSELCAMQL